MPVYKNWILAFSWGRGAVLSGSRRTFLPWAELGNSDSVVVRVTILQISYAENNLSVCNTEACIRDTLPCSLDKRSLHILVVMTGLLQHRKYHIAIALIRRSDDGKVISMQKRFVVVFCPPVNCTTFLANCTTATKPTNYPYFSSVLHTNLGHLIPRAWIRTAPTLYTDTFSRHAFFS